MQYKEVAVGGTVYFWFAANLTTGAAGDGATPLYDVRLAGAASNAAPTASGTPTLLSHANYTDGLHEIAVDSTGYAQGEYAVFCTLTISSVNPAGFVGSFLVTAASSTSRDYLIAINAKTTNLPSDPADASVVAGLIAAVDTKIDTIDNLIDTEIGTLTTELAKVPKSDSNVTWNATALASLQAEATDALNAYDPPTHAELTSGLAAADDATLAAIAALQTLVEDIPTSAESAEIQDIVDALLDEANADHLDAGSVGLAISTGGTASGLITTLTTYLTEYFQLALLKGAHLATDLADALSRINANTGTGTGTYDNTAHSQEEIADAGGGGPSAATIADAVWDEAIIGHLTGGSTGASLNGAGSAGDPWTTSLPGAYGAGTAGKIIGDNINGTISSRASQTSVDTIDGIVDDIKTKTDSLTFTIAGQVDANTQSFNNELITGDGSPGNKFGV